MARKKGVQAFTATSVPEKAAFGRACRASAFQTFSKKMPQLGESILALGKNSASAFGQSSLFDEAGTRAA